MTAKRSIDKLIFMTGSKRTGFRVLTAGFDGCDDEYRVASMRCGHAIVRTLRQMAYERPDLFPALPC